MIRFVAVVVPARNEERRLARCLAGIDRARAHLSSSSARLVPVRVMVVVDRCTDGTQEIADAWPGVDTAVSDHGMVGAARALGVRQAIGGRRPDELWIACTDADSVVPPDWLSYQVAHADRGAQMVLGMVRPDPTELSAAALAAWLDRHDLGDGHPHVHGANLGVRADTYMAAGGFAAVAAHEDVLLADRVQATGGRVVRTGDSPVITSARTVGRAPTGMATYLQQLNRSADDVAKPPGEVRIRIATAG